MNFIFTGLIAESLLKCIRVLKSITKYIFKENSSSISGNFIGNNWADWS